MILNIFLAIAGAMAAVHLICTAAFLPPRSPWSVILEVAGGFASSIGVIVTALHADRERALMFGAALVCFLVLFSVERTLRSKTCMIFYDKEPR